MWDRPKAMLWFANFLYALAAVLLLYSVLFVVIHLPIFPLKEVKVEGELTHVTRDQIKLIVDRHLRGNFFTLDLIQARDAFQKLPWVRNVSVRRRWPDKLEVTVEEHRELARWGNIALVNSHGELFHAASDSELPVFFGPGNGVREVAEHYGSFSTLLAPTGMKIMQLALSPRRAWEIGTDSGMVIEVGREQMEARLKKFAGVYAKTLGSLNVKVAYADLRYPNGFAVRKPARSAKPAVPATNKTGAA
ncbi:MAG: cell division protein FtsQ/DivIB [Methylophilaceae bacterium]|jgi:cell division protein FtsQ|uniref:cell division protein FtsQ/DivIB n=1 Tax=Methylobacillus sp. MM3 TaxID=1848039 RepID=UPI0007E1D7E7|nr:FtsQ-type POTRA domain-containing protein [Methylobacillus sp. MM3]OAJ70370.1 cell division protein FtsQ [Methylobacillus sp. MM3]